MSKKRPIKDRLLEQEPPPTPSTASPLRRRQCYRSPQIEFDESENGFDAQTTDTSSGDSYGNGIPAGATSEQTAHIYQTALEMLANVSLEQGADFQERPRSSLANDPNATLHSSGCQSAQTSTGTQQAEGLPLKDSNEKNSESDKLDSSKPKGASTSMAHETQKLCSSSAQTSSISRRNDRNHTQQEQFPLDELPSTSKSAQAKAALRHKRGAENFDQPQTSFGSKASRNDSNQLDTSCPQSTSSSAQTMRLQTLDASTQTLQEDQTSNEGQMLSATVRRGSGSVEGADSSSSNYNFLVSRINDNQLNIYVLANEFTIEEPTRNHILITVHSSVEENDDQISVNTQSDYSTNAQLASSNSEQFRDNIQDESRSGDSTSPLPLADYISSTTDTYESQSMDSNTLESSCSLPQALRQVSGRLYQETDEEQELENMSQSEVTNRDNFACPTDNGYSAKATDYPLSETSEANTPGLPASTYQPRLQTQSTTPAAVPTKEARNQAPLARPQSRRRKRSYSSWSNQLQRRNMVPRSQLTRPDYKTVVESARDNSRADQTYVNQPHFRAQDFPRRNPRTVPRIHETTSRLQTQNVAHRWEQSSTYQDETRIRRLLPQFIQSLPSAFETRAPSLSLRSSCLIPSSRIPLQTRELLATTLNYEPIVITMSSRYTVLCLNEYQTIIRISPTRPQGVPQHNDHRGNSISTSTNATFFGSFLLLQEQSQELSIFILNDDYRITSTVPRFASINLVGNRLFLSRVPSAPMPQQFMQIHVRGSAQHVQFERERIDRLLSATLPRFGQRSELSFRRLVDSLACRFSAYFSAESTTDIQRLATSNLQDMQVDDSDYADSAEGLRDKSPEQITADTPSTSNAVSAERLRDESPEQITADTPSISNADSAEGLRDESLEQITADTPLTSDADSAEGLRDESLEQITADTPSTSNAVRPRASSSAQSYNRSQNSKISRNAPKLGSSNEILNVQADIFILNTSEKEHNRPQQTPQATSGPPTKRRRRKKKGKGKWK